MPRSSTPQPSEDAAPLPAAELPPLPPLSTRERQREAKRHAVLQAAAQLFNERGFHATSLDDIAARLKVTKPTLYYYVKSKDEILLQCVGKGLAMMRKGIDASRAAGGKAIDQLMACMQVYARVVTKDFGMCLVRIGDEQLPPESRKELRRLKSAIDQELRRLVTEGVAEGSIEPCDPKMTAFVIAGALSWIGRWYQPGGTYTPEQVAQQCVATLCNGMLRRPAADAQSPPAEQRRKNVQADKAGVAPTAVVMKAATRARSRQGNSA